MKTRLIYAIIALMMLQVIPVISQDCTLGIGGPDAQVIIQVFQLNKEQQLKMSDLAGELALYHKDMTDQIRELFDTHPQQTEEDLEQLAAKYRVLKDEVVATSKSFDLKLLGTFNERQYQRYLALCREANREPMPVVIKGLPGAGPE